MPSYLFARSLGPDAHLRRGSYPHDTLSSYMSRKLKRFLVLSAGGFRYE